MKKFTAIIISLFISAEIFADTKINFISSENHQFRIYDSVLDVSHTINTVAKFYGLPYEEEIPVSEYGPVSMEEAFKAYKQTADQGNKEAQWITGVAYKRGTGVQKDSDEAFKYLKMSFDNGYLPAGYTLAELLEFEYYKSEEAFDYLDKAAKSNIPYILNFCAQAYTYTFMFSNKIPKDLDKAEKLYKIGVEQNEPSSMFNLAYIYINEKKNLDEAESLLLKAAQSDYTDAYKTLGSYFYTEGGFKPDREKVRNATIQYNILYRADAKKYYDNLFSRLKYIEEQANNNDIYAMEFLGEKLEGINNRKSTEWYIKAADAGNINACVNAAETYISGKYVKKDLNKAICYLKASGLKSTKSKKLLLELYSYNLFIHPYLNEWTRKNNLNKHFFFPDRLTDYRVINETEAFLYLKHQADKGDKECMAAVAYCYENGIAVKKSHEKALKYNYKPYDLSKAITKNKFYEDFNDTTARYYRASKTLESEIKTLLAKEKTASSQTELTEIKKEIGEKYFSLAYKKVNATPNGNYQDIYDECYTKACDYGSIDAIKEVGDYFASGKWFTESYEKSQQYAFGFYQAAAKLKNYTAMNSLANMYETNPYIEQDFDKAIALYREALKGEYSKYRAVYALQSYGEEVPEEYKKDKKWWE